MKNKVLKILGININIEKSRNILEKIKRFLLSNNRQCFVITLNPEAVVAAQKDIYFRKIIKKADIVVADGVGLLWAAKFLEKKEKIFILKFLRFILTAASLVFYPKYCKTVVPERISGIDLIYDICNFDFMTEKRIYFLGAGKKIAKKTSEILKIKYPKLQIAEAEEGIHFPDFYFEQHKINATKKKPDINALSGFNKLNRKIVKKINRAKPNILFVAFGAPKQEKWISKNLKKMPSVKLAIGVGGSFDFISKKTKRSPLFFQNHSLEWFWRLLINPKRIKRIYNATLKFSYIVFQSYKCNK